MNTIPTLKGDVRREAIGLIGTLRITFTGSETGTVQGRLCSLTWSVYQTSTGSLSLCIKINPRKKNIGGAVFNDLTISTHVNGIGKLVAVFYKRAATFSNTPPGTYGFEVL